MEKIIKGKRYNTETAQMIGMYGENVDDKFSTVQETLYKKRTGEYFLHGQGGPWSKYGKWQDGSHIGGGEKVIPLTYNAAKEWGERHLNTKEFEEEFGEIEEVESTSRLTISIPTTLVERIRRASAMMGKPLSEYLTIVLDDIVPE